MRTAAQRGSAEVWVVDNASTDGSPALVRERHPWARLVESGENLGYGTAVNRVAARTDADWIAPANSDLELENGAIEALVGAGAADPGAAIVAPRLILPDGRTQPSIQPFPGAGGSLASALRLDRLGGAARWDPERPSRVPWATGAFFIVRRAAWNAVGGFDESQWMYAEDLDLCWRVTRAGWAVRYEPGARVHHRLSAAAMEAFGADMDDRWRRATYAWMVRRRGLANTWATAAIDTASSGARLALSGTLAGRRGEPWRSRARRASSDLHAARLGLRSRRALLEAR
jgi:GT2 family glycosyltransferase